MILLTAAEVSQSARGFLAAASVVPDVLELRPDYRVLVMAAEGLEPGLPDEISGELLATAEIQARIRLDGRAPEDVPQVAAWRAAYRAFGAKPQPGHRRRSAPHRQENTHLLIHPWDGAISGTEWRDWLAAGHDFGQLSVNDPDNGAPHVIPTHFAADGDTLLVHRPGPAGSGRRYRRGQSWW